MRIYAKGDRVKQATYGAGTVTEADTRYTAVDFDNHGIRKFSTALATLDRTDEPAPARPASKRGSKATRTTSSRPPAAGTA